ncbi:hypothetical protein Ocin01_03096 [Orchesella cincta]|uniref:Uncharacterized protein n=1 Tax=Orchesella cincta TaxID=48709 RepID=A0A1D2NEE9_ORCCI|nr:hypothetical protein Ocin01_03096 [Orchesella cincta]
MKAVVVLALFALFAAASAIGIGLGGLGYGIHYGGLGFRGIGGISHSQRSLQGGFPIGIGYYGLGHGFIG